jgi:hypothetical protein
MKVLDMHEALSALCKATGKPGMFLAFPWNNAVWPFTEIGEIIKAAPFLTVEDHLQVLSDGYAFILCDTIAERDDLYEQVVGDDGPTRSNAYSGPARVYALTCDANGEFLNENT